MTVESDKVKYSVEALIEIIDGQFNNIDGPHKVALLRTVASYYESLTTAEAMKVMITQAFNKL